MARTLLVTNDFPPRPGGIQQFVHNLAVRRPSGTLVVYASTWKGAEKFAGVHGIELGSTSKRRSLPESRSENIFGHSPKKKK